MMDESGRAKALDIAISQLKKRYGEGSIMKLGGSSQYGVEAIPTAWLKSLDSDIHKACQQQAQAFYARLPASGTIAIQAR